MDHRQLPVPSWDGTQMEIKRPLLREDLAGVEVIEMAVGRVDLVVIKVSGEGEIVDDGKIGRVGVPEVAAGIIVEINTPAACVVGIFVTEVELVNEGILIVRVSAKPGALFVPGGFNDAAEEVGAG